MGKKHQEGFTLIELFMLMMVVAITLGIGVPAFNSFLANARMTTAGNDLLGSLHMARAAATTRNRAVTICASGNWNTDQPDCDEEASLLGGLIVFVDEDQDGSVDDADLVLQGLGPVDDSIRAQPASSGDSGPPEYVSFRGDGALLDIPGMGAALRNIQLCDPRGDHDTGGGRSAGRWISISATGRPSLFDSVEQIQGAGNPLGGC